jgi:hypothetical protein
MAGGKNFQCSNCYVVSGDDALQFVPITPQLINGSVPPYQNVSIADSQYVNCIGYSAAARVCSVMLDNRSTSENMTANITNCAFIGIRGQGGSAGALCGNRAGTGSLPSTGTIFGIQFIGVSLSLNATATDSNFQVQRDLNGNCGPIRQIDFIGCTAFDGRVAPGLFVQEASGVRWIGGSIVAGATSQTAVVILSSEDCEVRDTTVVCSSEPSTGGPVPSAGIFVGSGYGSTGPSNQIRISGVTVARIPQATPGIALVNTDACVVASSILQQKQPDSQTIRIYVDNSTNCVLDGNDTRLVDKSYDFKVSASGFIDAKLGAATQAAGMASHRTAPHM